MTKDGDSVALNLRPSSAALLFVDLQRCFVDESSRFAIPGAEELISTLNALAQRWREHGGLVIFTAHLLRSDHSNGGNLPDLIPDVAEGMIDEDNEGQACDRISGLGIRTLF